MKEITKYEKEMAHIITEDKSSWAQFYLLMKKVEEEKLYEQANCKSMTAWVKSFCLKYKIHESIIWNRKKAGKVFENYQQIQQEKGQEVPSLEDTTVSMDSLVLLDKISKKAPALGAELTEKAIKKQITRTDLRNAYRAIKTEEEEEKALAVENGEDKSKKKPTKAQLKAEQQALEDKITATKIVQAFKSPKWLTGEDTIKRVAFAKSEEREKYKIFDEFRVFTGTSTKSRRVDVMAVENITTEERLHDINLHGIEIKVSKHDLINDGKYTEYAEFCNYLWLAIPPELLKDAEETAPEQVGILTVDKDGNITRVRYAQENKNPFRLVDALKVLALKLI